MRQMEYVYGQSLDARFHRAVDNYIGVMSFLQECVEVCLFQPLNVVVFFYIRLHHKEACRIHGVYAARPPARNRRKVIIPLLPFGPAPAAVSAWSDFLIC